MLYVYVPYIYIYSMDFIHIVDKLNSTVYTSVVCITIKQHKQLFIISSLLIIIIWFDMS